MENKDGYIYKLLTSLCPSKANLKRDPWDSTLFMIVRRSIRRGMVRMKEIKEREREREVKREKESERERGGPI